jgi:hypothetical protein
MNSLINFPTNLIKQIGDLPNTFWGICILGASMYIAVKYNSDIGYYFAGVGSTLLGITHTTASQQPNQTLTVGSNPPVKVESNASDTSGKS